MMNIRNARFNQFGGIDCEVEARGEWVPFTASEDDSEAFGRQVYAAAAADSGTAAYVAPDPEPEPDPSIALAQARAAASMSRLNFAKLALREGWITAAEAKAWVPGNALPKIVTDIIAQHIEGADKQDIAEINALGQMVVNRNDLLLRLLMMSKKVTDAQMDAHFGIAG